MTLSGALPLPIELLSFTAKNFDDFNLVEWVTKTETNNNYFTLERSADGNEFEFLGNIQGAGNSVSSINYSFKDLHPLDGTNYYRLKQTDFNGEFKYSNVIAVQAKSDNVLQVKSLRPNPAKELIYLDIYSQENISIQVVIHDVMGNTVDSKNVMLTEGMNTIQNNLNDYKSGFYFVSVIVPKINKVYNSKFVKIE